jgi:hypothetical protein
VNGAFATNLTLPTGGVDIVTAKLTDAAGDTGSTPPLMIAVSGGVTATFNATHGNVVNLFNASATWDTVDGANGYVILHASKAVVNGGGDQIYTDSASVDALKLTGTSGDADFVAGDNTAIELDNAQANIQGAADPVVVASGAANAISGTGGLAVTVAAGAAVSLAAGAAYHVAASQATVSLLAGAEAYLTGASNTISLGASASLDILNGAGDIVTAASGDRIADAGAATLIKAGGSVGTLKIYNFGDDPTGVVDLLGGAGGYTSPQAAFAALISDGAGGADLPLGAGAIDFISLAASHLSAANFRIG